MKPTNFQPTDDFWNPAESRYDDVPIVRSGRSGLHLPRIALGTWHNFGDDTPFQTQRDIMRYAFDRGVIHFDIANNYGPPLAPPRKTSGGS